MLSKKTHLNLIIVKAVKNYKVQLYTLDNQNQNLMEIVKKLTANYLKTFKTVENIARQVFIAIFNKTFFKKCFKATKNGFKTDLLKSIKIACKTVKT